jgi:hypothetical protein
MVCCFLELSQKLSLSAIVVCRRQIVPVPLQTHTRTRGVSLNSISFYKELKAEGSSRVVLNFKLTTK